MKKFFLTVAVLMILALVVGGAIGYNAGVVQTARGGSPAVPLEAKDARDAEEIFNQSFSVRTRPVVVRLIEANTNITSNQTFTITVAVKNVSALPEEVIYYFAAPLDLSGAVVIKSDAPAKSRDPQYYTWGTKTLLYGGEEQTLYISLSPGPNYPGPTEIGEFLTNLKIVRWLGPRG